MLTKYSGSFSITKYSEDYGADDVESEEESAAAKAKKHHKGAGGAKAAAKGKGFKK